ARQKSRPRQEAQPQQERRLQWCRRSSIRECQCRAQDRPCQSRQLAPSHFWRSIASASFQPRSLSCPVPSLPDSSSHARKTRKQKKKKNAPKQRSWFPREPLLEDATLGVKRT